MNLHCLDALVNNQATPATDITYIRSLYIMERLTQAIIMHL